MNTKRLIILLFIIVLVITFTGCDNKPSEQSGNGTEATVEPTKQSVTEKIEEETEAVTEPPVTQTPSTDAPEEQTQKAYTGLELAKMNMKDIISIMGGDYDVKTEIVSPAFSSEPIDYYYNEKALPGFYFTELFNAPSDFDTNEFAIAMIDGAKLNDSISSDMTYNELAAVLGDFDVQGVVASYTYYTTIDGHSVGFIFEMSDDLHQYASQGSVSSDALKEINPKLQSIGIRSHM